MKKQLLTLFILLVVCTSRSFAQTPVVVSWPFNVGNPAGPGIFNVPLVTGASSSVVALNAYLGWFGGNNLLAIGPYGGELFGYGTSAATAGSPTWPSRPTASPQWYIEFPVSPAPGYNLTIDSMSHIQLRAENAPTTVASVVQLSYALDSSAIFTLVGAPITDPYATIVTGSVPGIHVVCPAGHTLRFRLYTYGASPNMAPTRTLDLKGVVFMGSTTSIITHPTVSIAPDTQVVCSGTAIATIKFSGSPATNTVYHWTNSDTTIGLHASDTGNISSFIAINHRSVNDTAVITVTPIAATDSGIAKKAYIIIKPTPTIVLSADTTICAGNTARLTASGAASFSWSPTGTLSAATGSTVTATPATTTTYTVTGTTSSCTDSNTVTVKTAVSPTDSIIIAAPGVICSGHVLLLQAIADTSFRYQWILNGNAIPAANGPIYSAFVQGAYNIRITSSAGCNLTTHPVQVDSMHIDIPVINRVGLLYCIDSAYTTYQWYIDGLPVVFQNGPCIEPALKGLYTITVTDSAGCSATSAPYGYANGVSTVAAEQVRLYPNPASATLNIDAPKPVTVSLSCLDGKKVMYVNNARTVDISTLPAGIYVVKIYDGEVVIKVEKLVKTGW